MKVDKRSFFLIRRRLLTHSRIDYKFFFRNGANAVPQNFQEDLLSCPLKELQVDLEGPSIAPYLTKLNDELASKNIAFRPTVWISDDWFSPDGIPGFAIPFYLLSPKLLKMERKYTGLVEGTNPRHLMQLLRHETAHALDNAFGLRQNKARQKLFGLSKVPYPKTYTPDKNSDNFVTNLPDYYAQSHPEEDFAETFAVWLDPSSHWKKKYRKSPRVLEKLMLVDELMSNLNQRKQKQIVQTTHSELRDLKGNLGAYYLKKRKRLGIVELIDLRKDLHKIFSNKVESKHVLNAAKLIRSEKKQIVSEMLMKSFTEKRGNLTIKKKKVNQLLTDVHNYCRLEELTTNNSKKSMETLSRILVKKSQSLIYDKNRIIM